MQLQFRSGGQLQALPLRRSSLARLACASRRRCHVGSATRCQAEPNGSSSSSRDVRAAAAPHVNVAVAAVAPAPAAMAAGKKAKTAAMDGNEATARIAYMLSDVSFIYPITPSTPMGELVDQWAADGKRNLFGNVMQVTEMESEAGVAGALHGGLAAGALATTFTCSQGLLLMIPNMYKISGELMPCVMHVTARALAGHALSIFGDQQDVMAVRSTGWTMLCSHSVQEAHDMALVSHLATLAGSVPVVHFFDGFRTSHEINKINLIDEEDIKPLLKELEPAIAAHHARALNPSHPHQRGTAQGPDVYMQALEAANPFHAAMPGIVQAAMDKVASITGRQYRLFDYVGHPEAENVVVAMGSGCEVIETAVNKMVAQGQKVGLLKVHLFRPWSSEHLLAALPKSAKRIAVLDRTKDHGAGGEPLLIEVSASLQRSRRPVEVIVGGRYGLGSKDFTPGMAMAVFANLASAQPKDNFSVGIVDDVTFHSLAPHPEPEVLPAKTTQCLFWGMGSDGTVGANKEAVKIICSKEDMHAQAYFSYDAHKSGGVTVSHLRFGPVPIVAPYLVGEADYLGVHQMVYFNKFDTLAGLKPGGVVLVNAPWKSWEEIEAAAHPRTKTRLAQLRPQLYCLDANAVAAEVGLGRRVNMVMQAAFFALSGVVDIKEAIPMLKDSIKKAYGKKGDKVVNQNYAAVDAALDHLIPIEIPADYGKESAMRVGAAEAAAKQTGSNTAAEFLEKVVKPMLAMEGDKLPVSVFTPGGFFPPGTTVVEKRAIAEAVPTWDSGACSQCNICAFVCPHAAVRPALAKADELSGAPSAFHAVPIKGGAGLKEYQYRVQVSPYDCTGCNLCVHACPDHALTPAPLAQMLEQEAANWDFFKQLPSRGDLFDKATVRGSQFQQPLMEFSGACDGCGETPYVKLLTQMFGNRMIVANATGCSSIWGGSAPSNPYTIDAEGRGPAWANSLFEDNAQFGFGIALGLKQRRQALEAAAKVAIQESAGSEALRAALAEWLPVKDNGALAGPAGKFVAAALQDAQPAASPAGEAALGFIKNNTDLLDKPSVWIVGGDGWAYDIGFAGVDHVLSTGEDVNILVLDTEEYSNTGGQKSKATPLASVVKFAAGGKSRPKKEMGLMTMQGYPDVYVASCCLEANYGQVVKAFSEAEAHPGPSLILAYSPCAMHGIAGSMSCSQNDAKLAVDSGYWPLYRYQPGKTEGDGKLVLDSKKIKSELDAFLKLENRFMVLQRKDPEAAKVLHDELEEHIQLRQERLKSMAEASKKKIVEEQ